MKRSDVLPVIRSAKNRTLRVVHSVKTAMSMIEREIAENEGIYPRNGGRLTMAEVCRRSGVHQITMMGKAHRDTTRPMIVRWIQGLKLIGDSIAIRGTVTKRADAAREEYRKIASQFQAMYQVEIPRRDREIEQLRLRISQLEADNSLLLQEIAFPKVTHLPSEGRKK